MIFPRLTRIRLILFSLSLLLGPAAHGDEAHDWLVKMERAARTVSYEGVFVYQHGATLESMRVIHSAKDGAVRERLVSLNGPPREVVRTEKGVQCYFPDDNSVAVQRHPADTKGFPTIIPQRLAGLDDNYDIHLGPMERVADRPAQLVTIKPKDAYRYGYRLWADQATGLLVKANLLDVEGKPIEKFMFTHIQPGVVIPPADLQPKSGKELAWQQDDTQPMEAKDTHWNVDHLPSGFTLSAHLKRKMASRKNAVEHFVYSDGLAAVSVFIERVENDSKPLTGSAAGMGALHAFGRIIGDHQITVVGEVPAATVNMIGQSVSHKDQ